MAFHFTHHSNYNSPQRIRWLSFVRFAQWFYPLQHPTQSDITAVRGDERGQRSRLSASAHEAKAIRVARSKTAQAPSCRLLLQLRKKTMATCKDGHKRGDADAQRTSRRTSQWTRTSRAADASGRGRSSDADASGCGCGSDADAPNRERMRTRLGRERASDADAPRTRTRLGRGRATDANAQRTDAERTQAPSGRGHSERRGAWVWCGAACCFLSFVVRRAPPPPAQLA